MNAATRPPLLMQIYQRGAGWPYCHRGATDVMCIRVHTYTHIYLYTCAYVYMHMHTYTCACINDAREAGRLCCCRGTTGV